jgi:hypothetical protein
MEPENLEYLYALADHYIKRGEFRKALPIAERMSAAHPEQRIGRELRAYIQKAMESQ